MYIDTLQKVLDAKTLAADVFHLALVLLVDRLHDEVYQHGTFLAQLLEVNLLRIVRTVHRLTVMDEVRHLDIEHKRFFCIAHVKCVKRTILRDDAHIGLFLEILHGCFYTDNILRTVRLASYQIL